MAYFLTKLFSNPFSDEELVEARCFLLSSSFSHYKDNAYINKGGEQYVNLGVSQIQAKNLERAVLTRLVRILQLKCYSEDFKPHQKPIEELLQESFSFNLSWLAFKK